MRKWCEQRLFTGVGHSIFGRLLAVNSRFTAQDIVGELRSVKYHVSNACFGRALRRPQHDVAVRIRLAARSIEVRICFAEVS